MPCRKSGRPIRSAPLPAAPSPVGGAAVTSAGIAGIPHPAGLRVTAEPELQTAPAGSGTHRIHVRRVPPVFSPEPRRWTSNWPLRGRGGDVRVFNDKTQRGGRHHGQPRLHGHFLLLNTRPDIRAADKVIRTRST